MSLSKAGVMELAASIMVFSIILAGLGFITTRERASNDSIKIWQTCGVTDRAQAFILNCAYVDPNSGNIYPIIDAEKNMICSANSSVVKLGDYGTIFQFPALALRADDLSIITLNVVEK